jgi:uncharacterized membrane protein
MADVDPSPNRGVMIVLAYLWPLALVPLLLEKRDADVQWHAKHGLVLMFAEGCLIVLYLVVTSLVGLRSLGLGAVLVLVLVFGWIGILALHVVAIVKGVSGTRLIIPIVSRYADARHG